MSDCLSTLKILKSISTNQPFKFQNFLTVVIIVFANKSTKFLNIDYLSLSLAHTEYSRSKQDEAMALAATDEYGA